MFPLLEHLPISIGEVDTNSFQVQANFGNGYVDLGTQQLMSVPYALYSGSSGNGSNGQNSNYNPSADSVLTLIGKISLYPGTYTIPQNEVWELEAINVIGALPTLTGSYSFCETYQYNANLIKCYYSFAQSEIPLFTLDSWSFQASVAFNYQYLPRTDFLRLKVQRHIVVMFVRLRKIKKFQWVFQHFQI